MSEKQITFILPIEPKLQLLLSWASSSAKPNHRLIFWYETFSMLLVFVFVCSGEVTVSVVCTLCNKYSNWWRRYTQMGIWTELKIKFEMKQTALPATTTTTRQKKKRQAHTLCFAVFKQIYTLSFWMKHG